MVSGLKVSAIFARSTGSVIGRPTGSPVLGQPDDAVGAKALTASNAATTATAPSTTRCRTAAKPYGTGRSARAAVISVSRLRDVRRR